MDDDSLMDSPFEDGENSDFEPVKPKAKAVKATKPKAAAPKKTATAGKPRGRPAKDPSKPKTTKAAPKKKKAVESDDENSDVDMRDLAPDHDDDDSLLADTPPNKKKAPGPKKTSGKPLADIANESFGMEGADESPKAPAKGASSKYQMVCGLVNLLSRIQG